MRGIETRFCLGMMLVAFLACTHNQRNLDQELAEAAERGDTAAVRALLKAGANVNGSYALSHVANGNEWIHDPPRSPLMQAAVAHHSDTVGALLAAGANANWQNDKGETALCLTVSGDWHVGSAAATFRTLVEAKVDVNTACGRETPLSVAAEAGNAPAVEALLEAGAKEREAALWHAARIGQTEETLDVLLRSGASVDYKNPFGQSVLGAAAESGNLATVKALLARGAQVQGALKYATTAAVAEALMEAGANARLDGPGALVDAARWGHDDLTQTLLRAGASARGPEGAEALRIAGQRGHTAMVTMLKQAGATLQPPPAPPQAEWTKSPLIKAAADGDLQGVRTAIAKGADVNATIGGWAALEAAANSGHTEVVRALIAAGADAKGNIGRKAMKQAILGGHAASAKALIAAGVDVKGAAGAEFTPLVPSGHPEMFRILQQGGEAQ